jgi:hypothetical protein
VKISGNETGAFVGGGSAFKKCPAPGKRKSAGETDPLALMPLHPALNNVKNTSIASHKKLQFNLTCPV